MQQQQPPSMMPSYPPSHISTEQIQKYLDENKKLILAIMDNQNLGKLTECAQYQAQLQKNLMYLAAIADAQPPAPSPAIPPQPQMAPHPAMQQGGYYMQHPQAAAMNPQQGIFSQKMPLQFNAMHQLQDPQQHHAMQQHHAIQGQMLMRPGGTSNGMHQMHSENTLGGGVPPQTAGPNAVRSGGKQDEAGTAGADAHGDGSEEGK